MDKKFLRIEVCGGIASGKTTLASLLSIHNFLTIFENFQSNPFWEKFYEDPIQYSFETELTFLLQHYHQIKVQKSDPSIGPFVCDFSLTLDLAYAYVTLNDSQRRLFIDTYTHLQQEISLADLCIHLNCPVETQLARIHKRGRSTEQGISSDFLNELNISIKNRLNDVGDQKKIIHIDSDKFDFATNNFDQTKVIEEIINAMN